LVAYELLNELKEKDPKLLTDDFSKLMLIGNLRSYIQPDKYKSLVIAFLDAAKDLKNFDHYTGLAGPLLQILMIDAHELWKPDIQFLDKLKALLLRTASDHEIHRLINWAYLFAAINYKDPELWNRLEQEIIKKLQILSAGAQSANQSNPINDRQLGNLGNCIHQNGKAISRIGSRDS